MMLYVVENSKSFYSGQWVTNWGQVFILAVGKKIGDVAKLNNILSRAK
jgi:hypothetical protein